MAVQVRASYKLTGWNANQLKLRIPFILTAYGQVMDKQLKDEIRRVVYKWPLSWPAGHPKEGKPRVTKRKNGSVVGSPRDIVDTGAFLRSQRRDRPDATTLLFTWNTPYASLILQGYSTNRGTIVPSRNWIKPALQAIPLDRFFAEQWRKLEGQGM